MHAISPLDNPLITAHTVKRMAAAIQITEQVQSDPNLSVSNETHPAKHARLTRAEERQMLVLRQTGLTYRKIAEALSRPVGTVYDYLQPLESTVATAQARLAGAADNAAQALIRSAEISADKGEHKAAVALLEASGAIQAKADVQVGIMINSPAQASAMPRELIEQVSVGND